MAKGAGAAAAMAAMTRNVFSARSPSAADQPRRTTAESTDLHRRLLRPTDANAKASAHVKVNATLSVGATARTSGATKLDVMLAQTWRRSRR